MTPFTAALLLMAVSVGPGLAAQPQALVYRGPAACDGCPESVAHLLRTSQSQFQVTYVGPNEAVDITSKSLAKADVYCQPGGGDYAPSWKAMKSYREVIRDYVSNGGTYMGFCVGAYLAGHYPMGGKIPGFGLLPPGDDIDEEITQPGAQVHNYKDTVINVDWHFSTGPKAGQTEDKRWVYFQDGAVIDVGNSTNVTVLGRYSSNNNVAATVSPFGQGVVGLVGPHPEATLDWYTHNFTNPDGIKLDIGYDFVETTFQGLS